MSVRIRGSPNFQKSGIPELLIRGSPNFNRNSETSFRDIVTMGKKCQANWVGDACSHDTLRRNYEAHWQTSLRFRRESDHVVCADCTEFKMWRRRVPAGSAEAKEINDGHVAHILEQLADREVDFLFGWIFLQRNGQTKKQQLNDQTFWMNEHVFCFCEMKQWMSLAKWMLDVFPKSPPRRIPTTKTFNNA